jgi:hypothetical protein
MEETGRGLIEGNNLKFIEIVQKVTNISLPMTNRLAKIRVVFSRSELRD